MKLDKYLNESDHFAGRNAVVPKGLSTTTKRYIRAMDDAIMDNEIDEIHSLFGQILHMVYDEAKIIGYGEGAQEYGKRGGQ